MKIKPTKLKTGKHLTEQMKSTNIQLNQKLVKDAMKRSKAKTQKEVVNKALEEYVKYLKRVDLANLRGKITFWEGYEG